MMRRPHVSWLMAVGSLGVIVGAALSPLVSGELTLVSWFVIGLCFFVAGAIRIKTASLILLAVAGLCFGVWRGGIELRDQSLYEQYLGSDIVVTGKIAEDPGIDIDGDYQVKLKEVFIYEESVAGIVWVSLSGDVDIKRSDRATVSGKLSSGFGNIPAALYRAKLIKVERQSFADAGRDVRDSFAHGVRESIREPEASLATGFLLGQKTALPEKLDNELRLLGLTHIVVASGYNLTILVRFCRRFFNKISRFTALSASGFLVFGFVQLTGYSPSMTRAALITGISLLTWFYGRKIHPFVLLPVSAAVTVIINPSYAWGDIGWLLSFTSFVGVIILSPLLHAYFWGPDKPGSIRQVLVETLSAQILTLPIIAMVFGQFSPMALLANVLILPFIPVAMLFTFFAGLSGLYIPFASRFIGQPAEIILKYITRITDIMASWPISSRETSLSIEFLVAGYLAIFCIIVFLARRTKYEFRTYNIIE